MRANQHGIALVVAAVLVAGALAAPHAALASEKMFKCVIDKRTVYQQQACPANAEPAASEPAAAAAPSRAAKEADSAPRPLKPVSRAASSAPATPR